MDVFTIRNGKSVLNLISLLLMIFGGSVHATPSQDRPKSSDGPAFARWLVAENSFGVLCTPADDLGGATYGDFVAYSDGQPYNATGIPYFYFTTLDPVARYALMKDKKPTFTIGEFPLGTCGKIEPENPSCAKLTLTGKLKEVGAGSEEDGKARKALFSKHAEMKNWPKDHAFKAYKLDIENIFIVNLDGGPKSVKVDQYFHPEKKGARWE